MNNKYRVHTYESTHSFYEVEAPSWKEAERMVLEGEVDEFSTKRDGIEILDTDLIAMGEPELEPCAHEKKATDAQGTVECLVCKETLIDMSGATEGDR